MAEVVQTDCTEEQLVELENKAFEARRMTEYGDWVKADNIWIEVPNDDPDAKFIEIWPGFQVDADVGEICPHCGKPTGLLTARVHYRVLLKAFGERVAVV